MNAYRCLCRSFASAFDRTFLEWDGGATFTYGEPVQERVAQVLAPGGS